MTHSTNSFFQNSFIIKQNLFYSVFCFLFVFCSKLEARTVLQDIKTEYPQFYDCFETLEKIDIKDHKFETFYELDCISVVTKMKIAEQYRFIEGLIKFCIEKNQRLKLLQIFNNFPFLSDYTNSTEQHLQVLYYKAEAYEFSNEAKLAMELYYIVYKQAEKQQFNQLLIDLDLKIGNLFRVSFVFPSAIHYYKKALERAHKISNKELAKRIEYIILNLKIKSFAKENALEEKVEACEQLDSLLKQNPIYYQNIVKKNAINRLQIHCDILLNNPVNEQLCPLNHQNYTITSEVSHHQNLVTCGRLANYNANYIQADSLLHKALNIAVKRNNIDLLIESYQALAESYKAQEMYLKALEFSELTTFDKNRIQNVKRMQNILLLDHKLRNEEEIAAKNQAINTAQNLLVRYRNLIGITTLIGMLCFLIYLLYLKSNRQGRIIEKQKNKLFTLNKFKDEILSIISHDLKKTSLSFRNISGKLNFLIEKEDYETLQKLGQRFEVASVQNSKLLNNLVDWARLQKGGFQVVKQAFSLLKAIDNISEMFSFQLEEKNITLSKQVNAEFYTYIDPQIFKTILINLIDNAIKFSEFGETIDIITKSTPENFLQLSVINRGIGFSEDQITIFNANKALSSTDGTQNEKGTGLGLKIINQLVELHNGTVKIDQKGEETIISVLFDQTDNKA